MQETIDLSIKDKYQAQTRVHVKARDLYHLKTSFENHDAVKYYQTFQTMVAIFEQQCETSKKTTLVKITPVDITITEQEGDSVIGPGLVDDPELNPTNSSVSGSRSLGDRIISSSLNFDAVYT